MNSASKSVSRTKKSVTSTKRLFVREIAFDGHPEDAHARLAASGGPSALLESARVSEGLGRWSVAAADPVDSFRWHSAENPFPELARRLARWTAPSDERVPFAGGAIGYLSYECAAYVEPTRPVSHPPGPFPNLHFLFFNQAAVFDHVLNKTYLVYCADRSATARSADRVLDRMERVLNSRRTGRVAPNRAPGSASDIRMGGSLHSRDVRRQDPSRRSGPSGADIRTTLPRAEFIRQVHKIQNHIARGDLFQANLTQQISFPTPPDLPAVYRRLKHLNPSPFFGILNTGGACILSGSPERLLRLEGRRLDTRPIAGTRPRGRDDAADRGLSRELFLSPKERAEHVMLVDLERNDLGRVCETGSVRVDEFMARETYSHVQHIVSNVEGVLRDGLSGLDALAAFFPGGTITGAPKVRAMEIIRGCESAPRGPYTGSMGYFSFSGGMDFNILIRSLFVSGRRAGLGAGAGIVADSDPEREYDETLHKAEAVLHAALGPRRSLAYLRSAGLARPRLS